MFSNQELQIILNLLQRVQIQGSEAETVVHMRQKIQKIMDSQPENSEPDTKRKKK